MIRIPLLLTWICGCGGSDKADDSPDPTPDSGHEVVEDSGRVDADGDGWFADEDCDDSDASVHPEASERCDGVDHDCDGLVDEDDSTDATTWYQDSDHDGYGNPEVSETACATPWKFVTDDTDCDDTNRLVHPGAQEKCNEIDDDCDERVDDEDDDVVDAPSWLVDEDGDGYGDADHPVESCMEPTASIEQEGDCDDSNAEVNPDATEICEDRLDNDCDGSANSCGWGPGEVDAQTVASAIFVGENAGDEAGSCVALGDLNADGELDALVGAPEAWDSAWGYYGALYVELGPLSGEHSLADAPIKIRAAHVGSDGQLGKVCAIGDVTGDGYEDLLAIDRSYNLDTTYYIADAQVYVFAGPITASLKVANADFVYEDENYTGLYISADDVDGDGIADLLASGPNDVGVGGIRVWQGPVSGDHTDSITDYDFSIKHGSQHLALTFPTHPADLNGDGLNDLFMGGLGYQDEDENYMGAAFALLGPITQSRDIESSAAMWTGETALGYSGFSVATGDVDGDGLDDCAVSAPRDSNGGENAGAAYILLGPCTAGGLLSNADTRLLGTSADTFLGNNASNMSLSDLDGDGQTDWAIQTGRPFDTFTGYSGGSYVFAGPIPTGTITGAQASTAWMGNSDLHWVGEHLDFDKAKSGSRTLLMGAESASMDPGWLAGAALLLRDPTWQ